MQVLLSFLVFHVLMSVNVRMSKPAENFAYVCTRLVLL